MAYIKIFTGGIVDVQRVKQSLQLKGIEPVVKDRASSALTAGFGAVDFDYKELFVHQDEVEVAKEIIKNNK